MKKFFGAAVAVLALAAAVIFVPKTSAAGATAKLPTTGAVSIPITRKITNVGGRVQASFRYRIEAKEGNPAFVSGINVAPTIGMDIEDNNAKIASSDCSLSLRNMVFTKVGNYAFTLSEISSSDPANYPIDTNKYDIFFEVTNVLDENNEPTGELQARVLDQMYSYKDDAKVPLRAEFTSAARYSYITVSSKVSGAAADTGRVFKYKVNLTGIAEGTTLTIVGQESEVNYGGETITTSNSYTVGDGDLYVYLKHGQSVTIGDYSRSGVTAHELPLGVSYTIEKIDDGDNYVTSIDGNETLTSTPKAISAIDDEGFAVNNNTLVVNNKESSVDTGVFTSAWPYLVAAFFGLSGFVIFRRVAKNLNA